MHEPIYYYSSNKEKFVYFWTHQINECPNIFSAALSWSPITGVLCIEIYKFVWDLITDKSEFEIKLDYNLKVPL